MTPTPDDMRAMAERLEGEYAGHQAGDWAAEAAAMLRAIADDAEQKNPAM